jgi:hypothetical protein
MKGKFTKRERESVWGDREGGEDHLDDRQQREKRMKLRLMASRNNFKVRSFQLMKQ